ncbi:hypothetical protein JG687_00004746 [Phytophthora cactorum]|uniref:IQ motif, EF-hand binding site n=1 Tax=Phytophthora cactorum TaxID=29920 RepID=A0A8T1UN19_9STRA|nr:hypothetical protein JG687_00004746 [Phytophthora cactorum]
MNDEERKALAEARGRVANLRAMFNKGAVTNTEPPAWKRRAPIKLPTADKPEEAEKATKKPLVAVKSSESLVDAAVQERKLREEQERRTAQEARDAMAKQSSYDLESDHAYNHAVKQKEYERSVEQKAKESLSQFTSDGKTFESEKREEQRRLEEIEHKNEQDTKNLHATTTYSTEYDQSYNHHAKQRETTTKAEQDAQKALRNFAGGKTYFEEQHEEKKRLQELERQKEQHAKEASTKNSYSSPDFDHAYVHAKGVAQVEKEAEEKAKAALLKYDQHDVSHEYIMKNGMMVPKHAGGSGTPKAKRYPFTDPAARIKKPSPQAIKALARFQEQLAESRAREERKASEEASRKASWESGRKMSIESVESMGSVRKQSFDEVDIEQIKASVDGAKLDVRSAAQKFADMDRKAAELAKQNKKPMTFNGVPYGHSGRVFRTKEQDQKEDQLKNDMATRIQSRVRGVIAREAYSEKAASAERIAIRIQTEFRRRQAQKQLEDLRQQLQREQTCAVVIQKLVRGRSQRNRYQTEVAVRKAAAVLLQSLVRTRQAQSAYTKQITAAHEIQEFAARMLAGRQARNEATCLRKERDAATVIQSVFRTKAAKSQTEARRNAVIRLQCACRQSIARHTVSRLKAEAEIEAATLKQLEQSMATKIQSHWRGSVARSEVATLRAESAEIESAKAAEAEAAAKAAAEAAAVEEAARQEELARLEEQARQAEAENSMATKIQSHWRGSVARSEVATLRAESAEIESAKAAEAEAAAKAAAEAAAVEEAARQEELARQEEAAPAAVEEAARQEELARLEEQARQAETENSMATKIQSQWRGSVARSDVVALRSEAIASVQAQLARIENMTAVQIQSRWRGSLARSNVAALRAEVARESLMAVRLQSQWRSVVASRKVNELRKHRRASTEAQAQLENAMALKIQCRWRITIAERKLEKRRQAAHEALEAKHATLIQAAWRGQAGREEAALRRASEKEASGLEKPKMRRQPTMAELQLLSQTGRFSNLSDDSDDDSEFEDVSSFVDAPLAPDTPASMHLVEPEMAESVPVSPASATAQIQSPLAHEDSTPRASSSSVNMGLEFSIPDDYSTISDDKSDASSDSFVDAMEEHKPIEHLEISGVEENRHWANETNNSVTETPVPVSDAALPSPGKEETVEADIDRPSSSISDFDRPSSVRSGSFFQEPSFDSDTPRGSLASSPLSGVSRPRDESPADPFRSREDSYADSTRSRGDSYAESIRSRNDSYADVFRSRNNSYDDVFRSRGDSYADVPSKTDFDEHNLSDEETHNTPKYFDTDSERASSAISDSPVSDQNMKVEVEKNEEQEEEQESRKKSGSRWRASSVLSALSSRRSSKPSSSPTSSLEDEEKDIDQKKSRSSTLPSVAASGLSSVAGMLNRKLSVSASNNNTKSVEEDIEESSVYSPPAQQASKSKSRFGRFTAPTVSKASFPTRFAWKSRGRRGTNDEEDGEPASTHAA